VRFLRWFSTPLYGAMFAWALPVGSPAAVVVGGLCGLGGCGCCGGKEAAQVRDQPKPLKFRSAKDFAKHYLPKSYAPCPHCNGTGVKRMSEPRKWGRL
jgi:hypothetical protein